MALSTSVSASFMPDQYSSNGDMSQGRRRDKAADRRVTFAGVSAGTAIRADPVPTAGRQRLPDGKHHHPAEPGCRGDYATVGGTR